MPPLPTSLVPAIDIGSSSTRTALFTERGIRIASSTASRKYAVNYSADGAAELNPAILLRAARVCTEQTIRAHHNSATLRKIPIVAVAGSAFWHSLLGLDRTRTRDYARLHVGRFAQRSRRCHAASPAFRASNSIAHRLHAPCALLARETSLVAAHSFGIISTDCALDFSRIVDLWRDLRDRRYQPFDGERNWPV